MDFNADDAPPQLISNLNHALSSGWNHSIGLDTKGMRQRYSKGLRTLVVQFLMCESEFRPCYTYLVIRTGEGLRKALLLQTICLTSRRSLRRC
jgi:hypothetical protein